MIDISDIDIENLQYETKIENGILYYYINGIKIDKFDLLAAATNELSLERAIEIINVADHLFGVSPTDYTYFSLRNCVYENIMWEKSSKTELYYQSSYTHKIMLHLSFEQNLFYAIYFGISESPTNRDPT